MLYFGGIKNDTAHKELFANYGKTYDREPFTKGTLGECDFIEREIGFNKGLKTLDVGCGTGRHKIELTKSLYHHYVSLCLRFQILFV